MYGIIENFDKKPSLIISPIIATSISLSSSFYNKKENVFIVSFDTEEEFKNNKEKIIEKIEKNIKIIVKNNVEFLKFLKGKKNIESDFFSKYYSFLDKENKNIRNNIYTQPKITSVLFVQTLIDTHIEQFNNCFKDFSIKNKNNIENLHILNHINELLLSEEIFLKLIPYLKKEEVLKSITFTTLPLKTQTKIIQNLGFSAEVLNHLENQHLKVT